MKQIKLIKKKATQRDGVKVYNDSVKYYTNLLEAKADFEAEKAEIELFEGDFDIFETHHRFICGCAVHSIVMASGGFISREIILEIS